MMYFQDIGKKKREKEEEAVGPDFEPWSSKRGDILARFTTTEKLSIVSCSSLEFIIRIMLQFLSKILFTINNHVLDDPFKFFLSSQNLFMGSDKGKTSFQNNTFSFYFD